MRDKQLCYIIALTAEKTLGIISYPKGSRPVKVVRYNADMDYAILQVQPAGGVEKLVPIPLSYQEPQADVDLKVFHFPVVAFNDNSNAVVGPHTCWVKSSIATNHSLPCSGPGLFSGSSGAPYVTREGCAVGIHQESVNNMPTVDTGAFDDDSSSNLELVSSTVNSHAHSHGSLCHALLIGKCKHLKVTLGKLGVVV